MKNSFLVWEREREAAADLKSNQATTTGTGSVRVWLAVWGYGESAHKKN